MRLLPWAFIAPVMLSIPFFAADLPTGPEVGATVPAFEVTDQTGAKQTFESLAGPNGLLLLFHRSADW